MDWRFKRLSASDRSDAVAVRALRFVIAARLRTFGEAIKNLRVRGAPAIGIAAAYGVVIGVRKRKPAYRKSPHICAPVGRRP